MFFSKGPEQGGTANVEEEKKQVESVSEYIEKKFPKPQGKFRTIEDKEIELEMEKIDREVEFLIAKKVSEFSFHIKPDLEHYPEIDTLHMIIVKSVEDYKVAKKFG